MGLCNLIKHGGMRAKLLWTNPSPNSTFGIQTIYISKPYTDFEMLMIKYKKYTNSNDYAYALAYIDPLRNNYMLGCSAIYGTWWYVRNVRLGSGTNALDIDRAGATGYSNSDNNACIPVKIYGITGKISGGGY